MPSPRTIVYWVIVVAFLSPFLIGGGMIAYRSLGLLWGGLRVDGVVVDMATSAGSKGQTLYSPIVLYGCGDSDDIVGESNVASGKNYVLGQHVYVYCDPDEPERFIIDAFAEKYLGMIFMLPPVAILAIAAIVGVRKRRRKRLRHE